MNELKINGHWKTLLVWFIGKKEKTNDFGSLVWNIGFNIEFIMKLPSWWLNSFHYIQSLIWDGKPYLLDLWMKHEKWGVFHLKIVRIWPIKCRLYLFESTCISLGVAHLWPISKYIKCVYEASPVYSMLY